jgi:hypothetical protein
MMFYGMAQQYHAERIRSAAEQRRADAELGMMAADLSGLWRRIVRALAPRAVLRTRYSGQ